MKGQTMTDLVSRARAALEGTTEGPWFVDVVDATYLIISVNDYTVAEVLSNDVDRDANARFIAAARSLVPEMVNRIAALEAENARLRTPDLFWDDDGYGFEGWKDLLDQSFGLDHVAKVLCGRSLPIKWAANECVSLDEEGDPDEIVPRLFDTPEEAARCWPDSLNRLRAALPKPPEADNA
jgi:hypothetical protein